MDSTSRSNWEHDFNLLGSNLDDDFRNSTQLYNITITALTIELDHTRYNINI